MARKQAAPQKRIEEVVDEVGVYPLEAYVFIRQGLEYTVRKLHKAAKKAGERSHVSGQQLCDGLRTYALEQWGLLARTVLERWSITRTEDFGRIVFALVESGYLKKTDEDSLEDFRHVFEFPTAFDDGYRIECKI